MKTSLFLRLRHAAPVLLSVAVCMSPALADQVQGVSDAQANQSPQSIADTAQRFLETQLQATAGAAGRASVVVDMPRAANLPACDRMTAATPPGARPRARVSVTVRCASPHAWTTFVQATISQPVQYFVAARPIAPGQTLTADDLAIQEGDLATLPPGAATDAHALIGRQASFRIPAGRPVLSRGLQDPASVMRGQSVRITARGNGFTVTNEGQALGNGAPGATVQVRTASGQTLTAIVKGPGDVEVSL